MKIKEESLNAESGKSIPDGGPQPVFVAARKWSLVLMGLATGCLGAHAGDDRFGFATHFEQGWPPATVMPAIASTGVSYIRDDLNAGSWEVALGTYAQPAWDMGWLNSAKTNGLKVVGVLGPNWRYADNYDQTAMSNLAAYIAKTGLVSVFEITNEPNNAYQAYEGSAWCSKLVALTNAVSAAVHAVNPAIQVIGLGAQGTQISFCLNKGTTMNGVVYHPYNNVDFIPETTYEWQWLDYAGWVTAINNMTTLPKWETEWGTGTSATLTNTLQAGFIARRLLQEAGLGIDHSFIYEFMDNGSELYGVETAAPLAPKPAFFAIQQIISTLSGVAGLPGGTGSYVTVSAVANGDMTDVKAYAYQGFINKTVVSLWFGNHDLRTPPAASTCSVTFTVPGTFSAPYVMSALTGIKVPLSTYHWSQNGNQVTVTGFPISDQPQLIVMQ